MAPESFPLKAPFGFNPYHMQSAKIGAQKRNVTRYDGECWRVIATFPASCKIEIVPRSRIPGMIKVLSGVASSNSPPHWLPATKRAASPSVTPQIHGLVGRGTEGAADRRPAVSVPHAANVAGQSKTPPGRSENAAAT